MASHTPGAPVFAPPADLPDWALRSVDLANPRLGAQALVASDDFFAEVARMLNPEAAQFVPGKFDTNGKWMDGWESRRKRVAGHDWALVRLGCKGVIRGFDVDTSHFVGNYPPAVSIEACVSASDVLEDLNAATWTEILPATALGPSSHHLFECASQAAWTH
ncbi:MAG: allantoicase, partial [Zoogloeaceae bacterium]|nr:allantoicase [Zoogloeaceae bacterium]